MKKFLLAFSLLAACCMCLTGCKKEIKNPVLAQIEFAETTHDFKHTDTAKTQRGHVFVFYNVGSQPLVINQVEAVCGCTTADYTQTPVQPGRKGSIRLSYKGNPGYFEKSVKVYSNGSDQPVSLVLKGFLE